MFVKLPFDLGMGKGKAGRLRRCIYGTRDACALWEATYAKVLTDLGFRQGGSSPCVFYHDNWGVALVVHGDDFTALGTDAALNKYEQGMVSAFDVELRGRLGTGGKDLKEVKILNRMLRVTSKGLKYEADTRHAVLLAKELGLEECKDTWKPGSKDTSDEHIADDGLQHEDNAKIYFSPVR